MVFCLSCSCFKERYMSRLNYLLQCQTLNLNRSWSKKYLLIFLTFGQNLVLKASFLIVIGLLLCSSTFPLLHFWNTLHLFLLFSCSYIVNKQKKKEEKYSFKILFLFFDSVSKDVKDGK